MYAAHQLIPGVCLGTIFLSRDYYLKVVPIELKFSAKVAAEKIVDNSTFHEIILLILEQHKKRTILSIILLILSS